MEYPFDVYGVGHALVDTHYAVSVEFLEKQGIEKGVMTLIDEKRRQALLRLLPSTPLSSASGGSAANTLIGVALFGGRSCYACLVGEDEWGGFYIRDLERAGVSARSAHRRPGATGQCLVFITPDADRTLHTFLGVGSRIGPDQIDEALVSSSRFTYLEGYLLSSDNGFAACRKAQRLARRHGTLVSLTLSDPVMVSLQKERFAELIDRGVDLLFCNEDEAKAYTGLRDRSEACRALAGSVRNVCVTCGPEGALLCKEGRMTRVPGLPVEAVDTTGAGDLFAGGVLFGLAHGYELEEAGKLGTYAAAQVVAQYGPRLNQPLGKKVDAILDLFR